MIILPPADHALGPILEDIKENPTLPVTPNDPVVSKDPEGEITPVVDDCSNTFTVVNTVVPLNSSVAFVEAKPAPDSLPPNARPAVVLPALPNSNLAVFNEFTTVHVVPLYSSVVVCTLLLKPPKAKAAF